MSFPCGSRGFRESASHNVARGDRVQTNSRSMSMKSQRVLIIVLALLVIVLGYMAFRNKPQEVSHAGTAEPTPTKPVEMWQTNVVERWRTNTELVTNTVTQVVTNELIKEVPAKLSADEKQAVAVGYKYLHAPVLEDAADALYKLGPISVDVYVDTSAANILGQNMDELKRKVEGALQARNVPVRDQSRHQLRVNISPRWRMSDPRVALVTCHLELRETAALDRQGDIVKRPSIVWSTSAATFVRTFDMAEEVDKAMHGPVNKFCDDYLHAKEREKEIQARIPAVPAGAGSE